jgi:Uma2 family endonuclease
MRRSLGRKGASRGCKWVGLESLMVNAAAQHREMAPQYTGLRLSADEYLALRDDGFKYQVINGVVVMSPSPTPRHQVVLSKLIVLIEAFLSKHPGARLFPDIDVRFGADLVYRPDLVVIRKDRLPKPLRRIDVVPDLIVEIVSPGSEALDQRTKRADYERLGVAEYWIVAVEGDVSVRMLRLESGRYVESGSSAVLPGFILDLDAVREAARD